MFFQSFFTGCEILKTCEIKPVKKTVKKHVKKSLVLELFHRFFHRVKNLKTCEQGTFHMVTTGEKNLSNKTCEIEPVKKPVKKNLVQELFHRV